MTVRRMTGEAVLYSIGTGIEAVLKFATLPLLGRYLLPAELGIADVVTATIGLLYFAVGLNLDQALTRYHYDESGADRRLLATTHALIIVGNGFLLFVLGGLALSIFHARLIYPMAWVCALLSLPLTVMGDHCATLFRLRHEPAFQLVLLSVRVLAWAITVAILLTVWHAGPVAIFVGLLLGGAFSLAATVYRLRDAYTPGIRLDFLRRSLRFALPTIPAALGSWAILHGPRYFLAWGASAQEVGFYGVGVRLAYVVSLAGVGFIMAWSPFIMGIKGEPQAPATLGRGLLYFVALSIASVVPLAIFAREIVRIFVGPLYVPATSLVGPMLVASLFSNVALFLFVQLSIVERTYWQSLSYLFGVIGMGLLNLALIPLWQSMGAAVASVVGQFITASLMFMAAQRFLPVPVAARRITALLAILAGAILGAAWIDRIDSIVALPILLKILLTLGTWGVCLLALGREELGSLLRFGRDVLSRRDVKHEPSGVRL